MNDDPGMKQSCLDKPIKMAEYLCNAIRLWVRESIEQRGTFVLSEEVQEQTIQSSHVLRLGPAFNGPYANENCQYGGQERHVYISTS